MSGYTDTLARLAAATERTVVDLHARMESGELDETQFVALAGAALARAKARGVALADLALSAALSVLRRHPVATVGLGLSDEAASASQAAVRDTLISEPYRVDPVAAMAVLGRAEALGAAQDAYATGMRQQDVKAWTRVLNAGACELCEDLAGDVLPASADMYHHKGCGCTQRPVD